MLINEPIDLTTLNHGMMQQCFFINPTLPATFERGETPKMSILEAALEIFGVGDSLFRLGIVRALRLVPWAADLDD